MSKTDPILAQINANRKRYLVDEKLRMKEAERNKSIESKNISSATPQSVLDGTDPNYGAPEGFEDYTSFGKTTEERSDSAKNLIKAEVDAIEKAKQQKLFEDEQKKKALETLNDPRIKSMFDEMNFYNAAFNQPNGTELPKFAENNPAAQEIIRKQTELGLDKNVPGVDDKKYFGELGNIVDPLKKRVGADERGQNKVTNWLIDVGLYDKPIATNIRGMLDGIAGGQEKLVEGTDNVLGGDVLRGSGKLVSGTLQAGMNMIPAVVGLNATMPIFNEVGGSVAEGLGYKKEQGEEVVGRIAPFLFGKWIGTASLANWGVDEGLDKSGVLKDLSPEDQVLTREIIGHLAFFGTLLGGKAITKKYLDPKLDEMFPYTRGMKADVTDPKVKRIMDDYVREFNEKKNSGMDAKEFNKWAQDRVASIIKNEKPAFFRNVKRDLDNLKEQRRYKNSQSKEPLETINVDPNQVNPETGFTDFKFDDKPTTAPTPGGVKQPETALGKKILEGKVVEPNQLDIPRGQKPIKNAAPDLPSSGKVLLTPEEKLKQITIGETKNEPVIPKDIKPVDIGVDRSKIHIKIEDDKIIDLKNKIESAGGKLVGIGGGEKPKYDIIYYDPVVDHPDAKPTTFTIPMDYYRKDPAAVVREVKRLNKKYVDDLNAIQEKKNLKERHKEQPELVKQVKKESQKPAKKKIVVKKKSIGSAKQNIQDIKLGDITKNEKDFQGRSEPFSGESFKKIVLSRIQTGLDEGRLTETQTEKIIAAANKFLEKNNPGKTEINIEDLTPENTFSWNDFGQVMLWQNPKTKGLDLLSGHSRTAASEFLKDYFPEFNEIPAVIESNLSFDEAQRKALQSNIRGTSEGMFAHVKKVQSLRSKGKSDKDIKAFAKTFFGSDAAKVFNISLLNPDGNTLQALKNAEKDPVMIAVANMIGSAKNRYPQLTNDHENEMYRWLVDDGAYKSENNKKGMVKNITQFMDIIGRRVETTVFNPDEPLNLRNAKGKGGNMLQSYENDVADKKIELNNAKSDLEKARSKWAAKGLEGAELEEKIKIENAYVNRVEGDYQRLLLKKNAVIDAEMDQGSLFNIIKSETNYPSSAEDIASLGVDSLGRNIPDWRNAIVYHSTDAAGIKNITKGGFKLLDDGEQSGYYGRAISFTPDYDYTQQFGDFTVYAKVSDQAKILNLNDENDWNTYVALTRGKDNAKQMDYVVAAGYDGVYDPGAGDLFIGNPKVVSVEPAKFDRPEFKSWFGKSKVADKNGIPFKVYHGSNSKFTTVSMSKGAQGLFWFTSDPATISGGTSGAQGTKYIMDLYVRIENPAGWKEYEKFGLQQLQDLGYDGVILDDGDGAFNGFVFNPNQVKSASRNVGSYSRENDSILLSVNGLRDPAGKSKQELELIRLKDYKRHLELAIEAMQGKEGYMPAVKQISGLPYSQSTYAHKRFKLGIEIEDLAKVIQKLEKQIPKNIRLDNQEDMFASEISEAEVADTRMTMKEFTDSGEKDRGNWISFSQAMKTLGGNDAVLAGVADGSLEEYKTKDDFRYIRRKDVLGNEKDQLELFSIKLPKKFQIKKTDTFKSAEGSFEIYGFKDGSKNSLITLWKNKNGFVVRNVLIPEEMRRQGIASQFYIAANDESIAKTGKPLRSSPERTLLNGHKVTELSLDGIALWDSLVAKGYAEKNGDKNYRFKTNEPNKLVEPTPEAKDLITVHNLTEDNLIFADRVGGLAMPSLAIVKSNMGFEKYGAVSLIADKEFIDPEYGTKVFNRDIYSPTYPTVYQEINKKILENKIIQIRQQMPEIFQQEYYHALYSLVENLEKGYNKITREKHNDALKYYYLLRTNQAPEPIMKDEPLSGYEIPDFDTMYEVAQKIIKKYPMLVEKWEPDPKDVETEYNQSLEYYKERNKTEPDENSKKYYKNEAVSKLREIHDDEIKKYYLDFRNDYVDEFLKKFDPQPGDSAEDIKYYAEEKRHFKELYTKNDFVHQHLQDDIRKVLNPKKVLDWYKYNREAVEPIIENQEAEYLKFLEDEFQEVFGREYLKQGKNKKVPHTLSNAVDIMGGNIRGAEKTMVQGLGKSATLSAKQFTSIEQIKKAKDRLVEKENFDRAEKEMRDAFDKLSGIAQKYYAHGDFGFERLDNLSLAVGRIAKGKINDSNIRKELYRVGYGRLPELWYDDVANVAQLMKDMPTQYFEAKKERSVALKEFAGALIPKDNPELRMILEKNGLTNIKEYDPDLDGSRNKALNNFTDQLFRISDEAANVHSKAVDYFSDSVLMDGTPLEILDKPRIIIATEQDWIKKYKYDPIINNFYKLKPGDNGYEPGTEKYRAEASGSTIIPSPYNDWKGKVILQSRSDMATFLEESVHIFQAKIILKDPELYKEIAAWENNVRDFAKEHGIIIPLGEELFAKSFVEQTGLDEVGVGFPIPKSIYDKTVSHLDESKSGRGLFGEIFTKEKNRYDVEEDPMPDKPNFTFADGELELFSIDNSPPLTPRVDKYILKILEDMPEKFAPEKQARLDELKKFKELSAEEKLEKKKLMDEKAELLAADPFEKHRLSTMISIKIRNLRTGYKIGSQERQKQITDLKKDIAAYARMILPRGEYRKSEITPILTDLAKANDLDGAAKVFNRIRDVERKVRKRKLIGGINKLIRNADRSKGDPDFVVAIKNIRRMSAADAEVAIEKIYTDAAGRDLNDEEDQFLYLLQRFSDIKNKSVEDLEDLYQELKEAVIDGRSRRKEWLAQEKARIQGIKEKSIAVITGGKKALSDDKARVEGLDKETRSVGEVLSSFDTVMHSWEWILDKLSSRDKGSTPLHSYLNEYFADKIHTARNQEDKGLRDQLKIVREKMMEVYGTTGYKLTRILNKNSERQDTLAKRVSILERDEAGIPTRTELVPLILSQNEAAYMIMVHEDPTLAKTFEKMGYNEDTWRALNLFLDPKVKQWARWQLESFYPSYYGGVNDTYKQQRGVDLQFNKKYMPISRDVAATVIDQEFLGDNHTEHVSIFNGHLQPRIANTHPIRIQDIDRVLMEHIIEMEHFKSFAAIMKDLRGVFGSREVSKAIKQYHSPTMLKVVNRFINDFARGGVDRRLTINTLDKIRSNFAKAVIGINPVVLIKQLTSFPAYLMDMPVKDFVVGVADFMTNPVGKAKFLLKNSEHLKSRYNKGWERDIILAMQRARKTTARELAKPLTMTDIFMALPKFGDAGAILFGGWAQYRYSYNKAIKAGKSPEAAKQIGIVEFEKATKRSQQAGDVEDLGELQRQGSWAKMWTLFKTSPKQYYSNMSAGLRNLMAGRGSRLENLKRIFVAHILLPQLFQFVANGFSWSGKNQMRALALGSLNGLLIAGDILETLLMAVTGDSYFSADETPLTSVTNDLVTALKSFNKWADSFDMDAEDLLKSIDELASGLSKFAGLPYDPVKRITTGVKEYIEDPENTSPLRPIGYSPFILKDRQEKSDTLQLIQERQSRLNKMKEAARKSMDKEDIEAAKKYERDLKLLKQNSSDYKKQQQDLKDKKREDPFNQVKKPKSMLGQKLFPNLNKLNLK